MTSDFNFQIDSVSTREMHRAVLGVPDITCTACVETIESLFKNDEFIKIRVNLVPEKEAIVFWEPEKTTLAAIRERIDDAGFGTKVLSKFLAKYFDV